MCIQEKKEYLKQYLLQESKINRLNKMCLINPHCKEFYKSEIEKSQKLRIEIEKKINSVDNPLLCEVLNQKYIFGKTLEEIALILNYSKRHIERLHKKGIENIEI